jgi:hypothetical protein
MRKVVAVVAALAVGAIAAVAYAQAPAQVNQYKVEGSVTPNQGASKKHPRPVALKFSFQVTEAAGNRPSPIETYSIGFYGGRSNGGPFPKCTAVQINAAQSDASCPKGSAVGTAVIKNNAGNSADPSDKSIRCDLSMTIYNAGANRAALYLKGNPPECVISISQAIDATYVSAFGGKGQALQFSVPKNLLHPIPGVDNAQVDVTSTIRRITKKVGKKTEGYFQIEQPCPKDRKAPIQVTFTSEAGQSVTAKTDQPCRP